MLYQLPPLPYDYAALEPYIDARTMEIHHTKHHQAYIDNLNKALASHDTEHQTLSALLQHIEQLPESIRTLVRNNGGGHSNHSLFWTMMHPAPSVLSSGLLFDAIEKTFGSFAMFQQQFHETAKSIFGSGWAWLCVQPNKTLYITKTENQDSPYMYGLQPILGLDVWEHAYYLKYQNKRVDYIDAWWHVVNWDQIEKNYKESAHLFI